MAVELSRRGGWARKTLEVSLSKGQLTELNQVQGLEAERTQYRLGYRIAATFGMRGSVHPWTGRTAQSMIDYIGQITLVGLGESSCTDPGRESMPAIKSDR